MHKPNKAFEAAVKKGYSGTRIQFEEAYKEEQEGKLLNKFNELGARFTVVLMFSVVLSMLWLWGATTIVEDYATAVPYTFTMKMFAVLAIVIGGTYYAITFTHDLLTSDEE